MSARIIVVTGTDTEIGKTFVTRALASLLARSGVAVRAVKPVESGTDDNPEDKQDGVLLARATGQDEAGQGGPAHALQRLRAPLAPPDAAELEGAELHYDAWLSTIREIASEAEVVLVEGAGGLLSPLTWDEDSLSLAQALGAEVVVVAPDKLGVQNHVRLVERVLRAEGVPVLGVVLNAPAVADSATGRNKAVLERVMPDVPIVAVGRHAAPEAAHGELGEALEWFGVTP